MATVDDFEELEVWKKGRTLQQKVFRITRQNEFKRDYRLVSQINDATDSLLSNISEGMERDGHKELIQYLSVAKGSNGEIRSHLWVAFDREYIDRIIFDELRGICIEIGKMLGSFIGYLKKTVHRGRKYKE